MRHTPEPLSFSARFLHDSGTMAVLALVLVPVYLMLNHYWQSLVLLVGFYGLLGFFCIRIGRYTCRGIRRVPAEIPPWHVLPFVSLPPPGLERHFSAADAIQSVRKDPHYVQEVLKPRLRHILMSRLSGPTESSLAGLPEVWLAERDPVLLAFLQRQEATGLWARYGQRQRRVDTVVDILHRIEAL
ncbi:MAG: hypothetical protein FJZ47_05775 [Candidatus Tectomicrobia bacterium]|uniref:Uncharacterized protein n=1 Tax=Tectimicrobiota bacterium TaxID=2528274 RepID=A0A937VYA4_UNCTE|nr:hypothetical protein [Candidatus Tectomicrobia bacterium]